MVAIAASGSGIAGLALWQHQYGEIAWACIAAIAAIVAVAKPLLSFEQRIKIATRQQLSYRAILSDLERLAFEVQQSEELSSVQRRRYQRIRDNLRAAEDADDPAPPVEQLTSLQERVNAEMPPEALWVPLPWRETEPA